MDVLVQELPNLLRHPFVLAIAAAVLTGVWVNGLTRRWQDRQKVLEVKTQLVASME